MGIKKIARPINKAKNDFLKWLIRQGVEDIEVYEGEDDCQVWDYYRAINAFIGDGFLIAYFTIWNGKLKIEYDDGKYKYTFSSIEDFMQLIS